MHAGKRYKDLTPEERAKLDSYFDEALEQLKADEPNVPHSRRSGVKRPGRRKSAARLKVKRGDT